MAVVAVVVSVVGELIAIHRTRQQLITLAPTSPTLSLSRSSSQLGKGCKQLASCLSASRSNVANFLLLTPRSATAIAASSRTEADKVVLQAHNSHREPGA